MVSIYIVVAESFCEVRFPSTLFVRYVFRARKLLLHHTAPRCNTLYDEVSFEVLARNTLLQHTVALLLQHTLQHVATHTATRCSTHCNTLQHTLQHVATHTATRCNTHCNTLQHTNDEMIIEELSRSTLLQHIATHCTAMPYSATEYAYLLHSVCCTVKHCGAVCCSVLQSVATECCGPFLCDRCVYDSFHWRSYAPEIHHIEKLRVLNISRYKCKMRFWFAFNLYWGIRVSRFGGFGECRFSVETAMGASMSQILIYM